MINVTFKGSGQKLDILTVVLYKTDLLMSDCQYSLHNCFSAQVFEPGCPLGAVISQH
jgi:hypothetical protein